MVSQGRRLHLLERCTDREKDTRTRRQGHSQACKLPPPPHGCACTPLARHLSVSHFLLLLPLLPAFMFVPPRLGPRTNSAAPSRSLQITLIQAWKEKERSSHVHPIACIYLHWARGSGKRRGSSMPPRHTNRALRHTQTGCRLLDGVGEGTDGCRPCC